MRIAMLLWTRPCCTARSWSRTHDPDGDRCCRSCPGEDSGSRGCQRRRADPVHLGVLPLWARRTKSLDALLPVLYLRGISTGDFQEALAALLGKDAPNLSPAVISRLTAEWQGEYGHWQKRDLSARRYLYVWADGVFLRARMEDHSECMLVLIGATPEGKKMSL